MSSWQELWLTAEFSSKKMNSEGVSASTTLGNISLLPLCSRFLNPATMYGCAINCLCMLTIRYDTRCYFNVRSKADISQLNLPHGTDN